MTGTTIRRVVLVVAVSASIASAGRVPAWASLWAVAVAPASHAQAAAQAPPAAPTGQTAACGTGKTIRIGWSAVAHASSYTISDSTTSATGAYATIASGIATTSWTSSTLSAGNYWFKVVAYVGANWQGAASAATAESTITASGCTQP
jgi:hypothetical protein